MIEKALELRNPFRADTTTVTRFDKQPGIMARALTFLLDALLFNGHSICCVDREIYSMTSRSHWLR